MKVYVGGTFDLFHAGHVNFLRQAAQLGEVYVALNTDEFAGRYKRPTTYPLSEREEILAACRYVAHVLVNTGGEDSKPSIELVGPDLIVHGDDWTGDEYVKQLGLTWEWLDERQIEIRYVPYTARVSTTEVIERVKSGRDRHVLPPPWQQPADPPKAPGRVHAKTG